MEPDSGFDHAALEERRKSRQKNAKRREETLEALKSEGNAAFKAGDYKKAVSLYAEAIEKCGQKPALCSNLAAALSKLELWEEADWAATLALKADPKMNKARFRRAMARKALKRWEAAMRDLEEIVALDPACKEALEELTVVRPRYMQFIENDEDDEDADRDYINPADVAYPRRNMEPFEYESDSDTEDCRHKGNAIACRFYNHEGCSRGQNCTFSHAPDDKSVRDGLGKNVCVHYLLGDCKYGDANCIYSHDKRYLPADGWWSDPRHKGQATIVIGTLEASAFDIQAPNADSLFHHLPVGRKVAKQTLKSLDNSRLQKAVQKAQGVKRPAQVASSISTNTGRFILLISLEHEEWFNFTPLTRAIKERHAVYQAFKANEAIAKLASPSLAGVIVTDAGIAKRSSSAVLQKLVKYVKAGGTAVIGCQFSNFIAGDSFEEFFKAFGLSWQRGSYHRTTHYLKRTNHIAAANPSLAPSYSMKALHADSISADQVLYGPTRDSVTQSHVFKARQVDNFGEAPVVIGKVGEGYVGYIGDVNAEKESNKVYLAMLSILDPPPSDGTKALVPGPSVSASTTKKTISKVSSSKTAAAPTSKPTVSTINTPKTTRSSNSFTAPLTPSSTSSVQTVSKDAPLLIVVLGNLAQAKSMDSLSKQLEKLERKTQVEVVTQRSTVEQRLASPSIRGIYIADGGILSPENSVLLPKLASYVKSGGIVVAGGLFPSSMNIPNSKAFFGAFGLTWEMGLYERAVYELVPTSELAKKNPELAEVYGMKAVQVKGINLDVPVYIRLPDEDDTEEDSDRANEPFGAPVVRARVGQGSVGYIGDVNCEDDTTDVILAMFGLIHPDTPSPPPIRKSRLFALLFTFLNEVETRRSCKGFLEGLDRDLEVVWGNLSLERMTDLIDSPDLKAIIIDTTRIMSPDQAYLLYRIVAYVRNGGTVIFLNGFAQDITAPECRPFFIDNFGVDWVIHAGHYPVSQEDISFNDSNSLVQSRRHELPEQPEFCGMTLATMNPADVVYMPKKVPVSNLWEPDKDLYVGPCLYASAGGKGRVGYVCEADYSSGEYHLILRAMVGVDESRPW